jgi:hypothetical protein
MTQRYFFLAAIALLVTQCRPDVITPFEPFGSQRDELLTLLRTAIDTAKTSVFTLQNPTNQVLTMTTRHGSFVQIDDADGTFQDAQGQSVPCSSCAEFKIQLREAMTNSQLVANGLTSKASTLQVAETSGAVHFEVFCNGKPLQIRNGANVNITALTTSTTSDMALYTAILDADQEQIDWQAQPSSSVFKYTKPAAQQFGYEFRVTQTGWSTGFLPVTGTTQDICVQMPKLYNQENTFAYLIFDNQRATIQMPFDTKNGQFCLKSVPKGLSAQLLVLSRVGEDWKMQKQNFNTDNQSITLEPIVTTEQQVTQLIRSL